MKKRRRIDAPEDITVTNNIGTLPDSKRAASLFATILRAAREQAREDRERQQKGGKAA
jgi:hypothetical protein